MALATAITGGNAPMYPALAAPQAQPASAYYGRGLETPTSIVQGSLESMLDPNSRYIQNARQRGLEYANTRGGINSSIAAGASERAAIEAAAPLAQQAVQIQQARESANRENWLSQQNFARALQGQFSSAKLNSSLEMLSAIQQYALEDPELYTPEVVSGLSDFFSKNQNDILSRYLSGLTI